MEVLTYYCRPLLLTSHGVVAFLIVSFTVSEVCAEQCKGLFCCYCNDSGFPPHL